MSIYLSHPVPLATTSQCMLGRRGRSHFLHAALSQGAASTQFQLDFSHTRSLNHDPHPSKAHNTSVEPLAHLTDLCQAAAPLAVRQQDRAGAHEVHPSPVTRDFPPTRPRFSNLHSSLQQDGEANDENLLDRSSLRHLDSPPTTSRATWHATLSGANRPHIFYTTFFPFPESTQRPSSIFTLLVIVSQLCIAVLTLLPFVLTPAGGLPLL